MNNQNHIPKLKNFIIKNSNKCTTNNNKLEFNSNNFVKKNTLIEMGSVNVKMEKGSESELVIKKSKKRFREDLLEKVKCETKNIPRNFAKRISVND